MKKIPCLFERDFSDKRRPVLLQTVTPGCEWVFAESIATRKRDGTACMVRGGRLFKRYDAKKGKTPPPGFEPCGEPDEVTGHNPGWVEVDDGPECKWHREAWSGLRAGDGSRFRERLQLPDGTYELCGPKINGNPEGLDEHVFICHGEEWAAGIILLTWGGIGEYLGANAIEGIVFHHRTDGRMCKIRRDDYGLKWPAT